MKYIISIGCVLLGTCCLIYSASTDRSPATIPDICLKTNFAHEKKKLYQKIPAIGIDSPHANYPYIPHLFDLHEFAKKKGGGVRIVLIDTGITRYHPDIRLGDIWYSHNLTTDAQKMIDRCLEPILEPSKSVSCRKYNLIARGIMSMCIDQDDGCLAMVLHDYTDDKYSIAEISQLIHQPDGFADQFHLSFRPGDRKPYVKQFFPDAFYTNNYPTYMSATHGTHMYGLIAGQSQMQDGIDGIAPHAELIMIKAFSHRGTTDLETIVRALEMAQLLEPDILNINLKISDSIDSSSGVSKKIKKLLDSFSYVVAAAGNGGIARLSYPARYETIEFDVGACMYVDGVATIPDFSQYEPGIGPKFIAPGYDIFSTCISPPDNKQPAYLHMHGTSCAAAITTGCVGLIVAEFGKKFSRAQILTACYAATFKPHASSDWKNKVLLGMLDVRTVLFILYAIDTLQERLTSYHIAYNIPNHFNGVVKTIIDILYQPVKDSNMTPPNPYDFYQEHLSFITHVQQQHRICLKNCFIPLGLYKLEDAIEYIVGQIIDVLMQPKISTDYPFLHHHHVNLFAHHQTNITDKLQHIIEKL